MRHLARALSAVLLTALVAGAFVVPAEAAAKPARLTKAAMRSAPVPSLCGYPAGRLRKGRLPGTPVSNGFMPRLGKVALGRLVKGSRGDAAVEVVCSSAYRAHDTYVLLYRAGTKGPVYRGKVMLDRLTGYGLEEVRSLSITKRRAKVRWISGRAGDPVCCGSLPWKATLKILGKKVKVVSKARVTEVATARAFLAAVDREDLAAARRYASRAVAAGAIAQTRTESSMRFVGCGGRSELPARTRFCESVFTVKPASASSSSALLLHLKVTRKAGWRVTRAFRAE